MTAHLQHQLEVLLKEMRDDLDRAKRLDRGTVDLHVVAYHAKKLDELLEAAAEVRYVLR